MAGTHPGEARGQAKGAGKGLCFRKHTQGTHTVGLLAASPCWELEVRHAYPGPWPSRWASSVLSSTWNCSVPCSLLGVTYDSCALGPNPGARPCSRLTAQAPGTGILEWGEVAPRMSPFLSASRGHGCVSLRKERPLVL